MKTTDLASSNILLPNGTFFVELIIFFLLLAVVSRFVYPPLRDAMAKREEMVHKTTEDVQESTKKLLAAQEKFEQELSKARTESGRVRDEARSEGTKVLNEFREQAHQEISLVAQRGAEELAVQRTQAVRELRGHVGEFANTLASRVVGTQLVASSATTARFFGEVDAEGDA
ncbi:MAG TPA: F0F1 ATP synthase subunit B [Pseudonocardiaceae bacterium]|jgi:F-type H+-transporting ATPase subunit b